jgi:hypothetical protein
MFISLPQVPPNPLSLKYPYIPMSVECPYYPFLGDFRHLKTFYDKILISGKKLPKKCLKIKINVLIKKFHFFVKIFY